MRTICTKCKSEKVFIVEREKVEEPEFQTMDEMAANMHRPVPLVYRPLTWRCGDCGYEVSGGMSFSTHDSSNSTVTLGGSLQDAGTTDTVLTPQ